MSISFTLSSLTHILSYTATCFYPHSHLYPTHTHTHTHRSVAHRKYFLIFKQKQNEKQKLLWIVLVVVKFYFKTRNVMDNYIVLKRHLNLWLQAIPIILIWVHSFQIRFPQQVFKIHSEKHSHTVSHTELNWISYIAYRAYTL